MITTATHRYYEQQTARARRVPGLEHELANAKELAEVWQAQSEDYQGQRNQERQLTEQLTGELRELQARLDGQQAEFTRQLREASDPVKDLLTDLISRAEHPVEGADFRKELALRTVEIWTERMTPEEHDSPSGLILRIITDTEKPGSEGTAAEAAPAQEPKVDPKLVGQVMDSPMLRGGPDPFPGIG
ncbi:hypothetical protein ACWCQL_13310 [Streptomyces sp. NPDC002073]